MSKITSVGSNKIELVESGYKIKVKTAVYFDHLYKEIYFWMMHHGYEWKELQYGIIDFPKGGERLELLWKGVKQEDDYSTFVIECYMADDASDVEAQLENGKKVKLRSGTHEFRIGAYITKKIDVWEGKPFGNTQAKLYEMLIRDRLENQKTQLYVEAHKFIDNLKTILKYYPEPEK
ncbi:MAG: hypothetical protein ABIJ18_00885 [archaeon]